MHVFAIILMILFIKLLNVAVLIFSQIFCMYRYINTHVHVYLYKCIVMCTHTFTYVYTSLRVYIVGQIFKTEDIYIQYSGAIKY